MPGNRAVKSFFLGSVASRVVSVSECPVMTVRACHAPDAGKTPVVKGLFHRKDPAD